MLVRIYTAERAVSDMLTMLDESEIACETCLRLNGEHSSKIIMKDLLIGKPMKATWHALALIHGLDHIKQEEL